jgi:hypothetical protein
VRSHLATFQFLVDQTTWVPFPSPSSIIFGEAVQKALNVNNDQKHFVQTLLDQGINEPLYHALFNDAWRLKKTDYRSAFVIGMTALEIGIKSLIVKIIPNSTWIVLNAPTPPIVNILKKYLPQLPLPLIGGRNLLPNSNNIKKIAKWVEMRNDIVHKGDNVNGEMAQEMLIVVRDVLYMIDFNSGYYWGAYSISDNMLEQLGITKQEVMSWQPPQ